MTKSIKKPNFFIIGAPKCGTTAMAQYLGEHPDVFFSSPKEPNFFNTDFSRNQYKGISEEEYLENYFKDSGNFRVVGEGSVWYLYSKDAVPNILKFNPSAKFIVMMRNPIDMVYSLHNQVLNNADEIEINFERAWNLQGERLKGRFIPKNCREPKSLQYGTICMIGEQVERLYQNVPREKVKLIFFDDFKNRTKEVFEEVLIFLKFLFVVKTIFLLLTVGRRRSLIL